MDLICDRSSLVSLASVLYFLGQVVATPLAGWAADKYGRRPTLLISYGVYAVLETALVFSRDYISFVLLRFLVGVARQAMNSAFFVLMMEWIPPSRRGTWGAIAEVQYTTGVLLITLIAFLVQNWTHIQAFIAALSVVAIPLYWYAA
ncbi:hypothetical protein RvY_05807-3 [Ramazzottius varieornatus]|uniref:Major facilitator superfamily (MFS) profile domain-containing protein n=1 Tax=Ramazzottius varieornatus TaxID=947166 RepID=A0A1D1UWC6_RAMVA|nr:hypothetical protein RvY_05807-3 [Ramazzottius varieornatus]